MFEIISRELIRSSTISQHRHFLQFFIQIRFVQFFAQSKHRKFPNRNEYCQRSSVNGRVNFEGTDRFVDETIPSSFDDSLRSIWLRFYQQISLFAPAFLSVLFTKILLVEFRGSSFNPVARAVANRECEIQSALQSGWKLVLAEYRGARIFNVLPTLCIGEYNEFSLCSASWRLRGPNLVLACSKLWSLLHWNEAHERVNFILRKQKPCSTKTKALFYIFHLFSYTM